MSNSSVFKVRLKVLRSSADRHLYDSEFQIEGALTVKMLSPTTLMSSSVQRATIYQMIVMYVLVDSDGLVETGKPECQWIASFR